MTSCNIVSIREYSRYACIILIDFFTPIDVKFSIKIFLGRDTVMDSVYDIFQSGHLLAIPCPRIDVLFHINTPYIPHIFGAF